MIMQSLHKWEKNRQENIVSTPKSKRNDTVLSSTVPSFSSNGGGLVHKGSISKPITRRRSRVSKKARTTLLNANPGNFRTLVQQFTGCNSSVAYKGPINLNFAKYNYYTDKSVAHNHNQHTKEKEYPVLHGESDQSLHSSSDEVLVSRTVDVPIPDDQLAIDDFDVVNFPLRSFSEPGYDPEFPETSYIDDFWGY